MNIACEGPKGASPSITAFTSNKLGARERSEGEVNLPVSEQREEMYRHIHPLFTFSPSALFWLLLNCLYFFFNPDF